VAERPAEVPDDGPSIRIEVTPRDFRLRGLVCLVGGLLLTAVWVWSEARTSRSIGNPVIGLAGVAYGVWCLVQARRQVTRDVLRIDRSGIRSGDGLYDQTWGGVVMVWVGSPTGLRTPFVAQPVLSVFTRAGVEFAARAGTSPSARYSVPVATTRTVALLCAELRSITGATVVSGHDRSRSSAARALQQPTEA